MFSSGKNLSQKLGYIYDDKHWNTKNLKIEIIDKKIYLNCHNSKYLISNIKRLGNLNKADIFKLVKSLQFQMKDFNQWEQNQRSQVDFYYSSITTKEGNKVPLTHPAQTWDCKINTHKFENDKIIVHATSNCNIKITASQLIVSPIMKLALKKATHPGTVITHNAKIEKISKFTSVKKIEVETVLYNEKHKLLEKFGIDLEFDYREYIQKRNESIDEIFRVHGIEKTENYFINEIKNHIWTETLININDYNLLRELEDSFQ